MSADMSPYCTAHDEWLMMKLCMYVGYHDAKNVSHFAGDPVTQSNFLKRFKNLVCHFFSFKSLGRWKHFLPKTLCVQSAMLHNNIKWPYQPKHSPSIGFVIADCIIREADQ